MSESVSCAQTMCTQARGAGWRIGGEPRGARALVPVRLYSRNFSRISRIRPAQISHVHKHSSLRPGKVCRRARVEGKSERVFARMRSRACVASRVSGRKDAENLRAPIVSPASSPRLAPHGASPAFSIDAHEQRQLTALMADRERR